MLIQHNKQLNKHVDMQWLSIIEKIISEKIYMKQNVILTQHNTSKNLFIIKK